MKEKAQISIELLLASKSVIDFIDAAQRFCLLIETRQSNNPKEFLETLQIQLLALYGLGMNLPDVFIENNIDFYIDGPKEQRQEITKLISERVPFSYYWRALNPFDEINLTEIATADLTDDLADIYFDVKRALIRYDSENNEVKRHLLWQFKFDFDNHWQEHCIDSLQIIYHYLSENR